MTDRREFVSGLARAGAVLAVGGCASTPPNAASQGVARGEWDTSWLVKVRRAKHRAVFDAPNGYGFPDLAARYLDGIAAVHGAHAPDVIAVLNVRTRAVAHALGDALWAKYPIGEDVGVKEPGSEAFARRKVILTVRPGMSEAAADATYERLMPRGVVILVCDFALGHLSARLATKVGSDPKVVHEEFRNGLVPGAIAVPSGIYGVGEAQNAGCGFVPA